MHSLRFDLPVVFTEHARLRMVERKMDAALILDIMDTGILKDAGNAYEGCTNTSMSVQTICYV